MLLQAGGNGRGDGQASSPDACAVFWFYARFDTGAVAIAEGAAWGYSEGQTGGDDFRGGAEHASAVSAWLGRSSQTNDACQRRIWGCPKGPGRAPGRVCKEGGR